LNETRFILVPTNVICLRFAYILKNIIMEDWKLTSSLPFLSALFGGGRPSTCNTWTTLFYSKYKKYL